MTSHLKIPELDELYESRFLGPAKFPSYKEELIRFIPTYKRTNQTANDYIQKMDQCPSYTDRILYKSNCSSSRIISKKYNSREDIFGSDHRPVFLDCII